MLRFILSSVLSLSILRVTVRGEKNDVSAAAVGEGDGGSDGNDGEGVSGGWWWWWR